MKIKFQRAAQQDLDDLIEYLTQRSGPRAAEKRLIRTYEALETIAQFPRASQFHKDSIRSKAGCLGPDASYFIVCMKTSNWL
jgi:plasmid stabilization system protein ParE